jgi:hypothetical protein
MGKSKGYRGLCALLGKTVEKAVGLHSQSSLECDYHDDKKEKKSPTKKKSSVLFIKSVFSS